MNHLLKALLAAGILALGIGFYFSPHLALGEMKAAARQRDTAKLGTYVDFPALRESLKDTGGRLVAAEMAQGGLDSLAPLGKIIADGLIGPLVDNLVTPEGLALLLEGELRNSRKAGEREPRDLETSLTYEGFDQVAVTLRDKGQGRAPIGLVLKRDGLLAWRLVGVRALR